MITLLEVAGRFNTELFEDIETGDTFYGQMMLFNESVRSGPAARRRVLEVTSDVVVPTGRVVKDVESEQVFILGEQSLDWWNGKIITRKIPVVPADNEYSSRSVAQILQGAAGNSYYMAASYIRRVILEESSDYHGGYEIAFPNVTQLQAGSILYDGYKWFRCRENSRTDDIGLGIVEVVELENPLRSAQIVTSVYDPEMDVSVDTTVTAQAFFEPLVLDYQHEVLGFIKPEPGDLAITVLTSAASLKANDYISGNIVLSVTQNGNTWCVHARRKHK